MAQSQEKNDDYGTYTVKKKEIFELPKPTMDDLSQQSLDIKKAAKNSNELEGGVGSSQVFSKKMIILIKKLQSMP